MWKPENNRCLPLSRVFHRTQSSFGLGNQPSTWDMPVSTILCRGSRYIHSCLAFYMGDGDLNSGPHACRESTPANWTPSPITKDFQECCGTNFPGETQHTHHTQPITPDREPTMDQNMSIIKIWLGEPEVLLGLLTGIWGVIYRSRSDSKRAPSPKSTTVWMIVHQSPEPGTHTACRQLKLESVLSW